jgi:hypothetical protein
MPAAEEEEQGRQSNEKKLLRPQGEKIIKGKGKRRT